MPRPHIPDWIRCYKPPLGWTNVFDLVPSNQSLYGTETLFGDWAGETLLLAKDGAPTGVIRDLRDRGDPQPWRHAQRELGDRGGFRTNERLVALAADLPGGKLYGSATANLLFDDPGWSRSLGGFFEPPLHDYFKRVLAWVLGSMPNIRRVACLGNEAWFLTCHTIGARDASRQYSYHRDQCQPVRGAIGTKPVIAHALYHPAARVSHNSKIDGWRRMASGASSVAPKDLAPTVATKTPNRSTDAATNPHALNWLDAPFPRGSFQSSVRDSPIRHEMLAILKKAGATGVSWQAFKHLNWKSDFDAKRVDTALRLLAKNNGFLLQYLGSRGNGRYPGQWRLAPRHW